MERELKNKIASDLKRIDVVLDELSSDIIIGPNRNDLPGTYYYYDDIGFYCDEVDVRGVLERTRYSNINQFLYAIYSYVTFMKAIEYELQNRDERFDFRRILFDHQLLLMKKINEEFYCALNQEIKAILVDNPFIDEN